MKAKLIRVIAVPMTVILAKIMTFIFDSILSSYYGAGIISDSFIMAYSIPTILFDGVVTAIITCFIPIYERLKIHKIEELRDFSSNIFTLSVIAGTLVSIIFTLFKGPVLSIYAKGFDESGRKLVEDYVSVIIWSIPISAGCSVFRAYLQLNGRKATSNISQIMVYAILTGVTVITYPQDMSMAYAVILGYAVSSIILAVASTKNGLKVKPYISFSNSYIVVFARMMIPVILGTLVGEINALADKYFSSFFESGVITSMSLGYKLSFSIQGIISSSLMLILYPILAKSAAENKTDHFSYHLRMSNQIISWFTFPLIFGCLAMPTQIIEIVFGHGQFTDENVRVTAVLFTIYLLGVFPMCLKHVSDKAFYAIGKNKYTLWTSVFSVCLNVFLNALVYKKYQYVGLAAVTIFSISVGAVLQWLLLRRCDKSFSNWSHIHVFINPLLASVSMYIAVKTTMRFFVSISMPVLSSVAICVLIGVAVYGLQILFFFRRDAIEIKNYIMRTQ